MKALFGVLCLLGLARLPARADRPGQPRPPGDYPKFTIPFGIFRIL